MGISESREFWLNVEVCRRSAAARVEGVESRRERAAGRFD